MHPAQLLEMAHEFLNDNSHTWATTVLTIGLEGIHNVQGGVVDLGVARLDGAPVQHDGGAVEAGHGHQGAGHVLVAACEHTGHA